MSSIDKSQISLDPPSPETLAFWIKKKQNVLFEGEKGIGKSEIIIKAFEDNFGDRNVDWLYFSGATLDPWVDFVGIPERVQKKDGSLVLELVKPAYFSENSKIKAIFVDELNRTHPRILNALMELIQFKSINGHKFPALEVVWGAVNPYTDDGDYHVERLDPAQQDRFQIYYPLKYDVSETYFSDKFDPRTAKAATEWWKELSADAKKMVSPRRLEYAVRYLQMGGDVHHVLPFAANPTKFQERLSLGSTKDKLDEFMKDILAGKDCKAGIQKYLGNPNNFESAYPYMFDLTQDDDELDPKDNYRKMIPYLSTELLGTSLTKIYDDAAKKGKKKNDSGSKAARNAYLQITLLAADDDNLKETIHEIYEARTLKPEIHELISEFIGTLLPIDEELDASGKPAKNRKKASAGADSNFKAV